MAVGAHVRALVHYNGRDDWGQLRHLPQEVIDRVEIVLGDVTDPFQTERIVEGSEVVFHLAALVGIPFSYIAPEMYVNVNVKGTLNILESCRHHNVQRLLHTSTSETYGTAKYVPIDERHPLRGQSPYSASKIGADKLVESYVCSFGVPAVTVRPFNTYGPRQSARAVIPTIVIQAALGSTVMIGNDAPARDLTYVTDIVAGFLALAECDAAIGREVNLGSGKSIRIRALAERILRLMKSDAVIVCSPERVRPQESEVFTLVADASLAGQLTGWAPQVSLDDGLLATIAYLREDLSAYRPRRYAI